MGKKSSEKSASKFTQCVHAGTRFDETTKGVNSPVYPSTSFAYLDTEERCYPRYFNLPNQVAVADKLAALEGAEAGLLFSSGMAAISTVFLTYLKPGDHAVFQQGLYGGTTHFITRELPRLGISWDYTGTNHPESFEKALHPHTRLIYIETPSNPLLGIVDIAAVAELGRKMGIPTAIDNTFASPHNQNPVAMGIDIVLHSATKYLGGHSDLCAGAAVSTKEIIHRIRETALNLGGSLNAQMCSLLERSMKTLAIRVERQNQNAMAIAQELSNHPEINKVYYPGLVEHPGHFIAQRQMSGFGGMLSFELRRIDPTRFQKQLKIIRPSMSLGGVDTTICSPVLTSHRHLSAEDRRREGITDQVLRLSVGIEAADDLIADLRQALIVVS